MKPIRAIKHCDIVAEPADALIYSTNVSLNCSGEVGSSLMSRYGKQFQADLHHHLHATGRRFAERGEVFQHVSAGMPYRVVFHTVPSDGWYETTADVIESVMIRCLRGCMGIDGVHCVALSALATGYGRLGYEEFFRIAARILNRADFDSIESIIICIEDESRFHDARRCVQEERLPLQIIGREPLP
jgi:O-acetyl-ADP-ribose deacetylase (regulator of RNase III)